jgi:hypothetical protein
MKFQNKLDILFEEWVSGVNLRVGGPDMGRIAPFKLCT